MVIEKGQVISDRIPERTRLQAQEKQLELSLERIRTASIQPPPKPRPVPAVAALPPISYLEHQAGIERAKLAISKRSAKRAANSFKLETLEKRITIIEQRLAVAEDRIEYTRKKKWTNYISANPIDIIQNIFGGGSVQRDNLAIASLEIRTADLLAAKAELERQQEEEKVKISDLEEIRFAGRVLRLLLNYEAAQRRHELLSSQLKTLEQQQRVARVSYRNGRGSTSQILGMEDKRDRLTEKIIDAEIEKDEAMRELGQLTGYDINNQYR